MKFKNIDRLLPFGYLYLVVLGLVKDAVLYFQLGINIGLYSSLTDILISPIVTLTTHPIFWGLILMFTLFLYLSYNFLNKRIDKKWSQKILKITNPESLTGDEIKIITGTRFIYAMAFGMLCFFFVIG